MWSVSRKPFHCLDTPPLMVRVLSLGRKGTLQTRTSGCQPTPFSRQIYEPPILGEVLTLPELFSHDETDQRLKCFRYPLFVRNVLHSYAKIQERKRYYLSRKCQPFRPVSLIFINGSHSTTLQIVYLWGLTRFSTAKTEWLASAHKNLDNVSNFL
jgi:hypothetical protein